MEALVVNNLSVAYDKKTVLENPIGITEAAGHVPFALLEQVDDVGALERSRRHIRASGYDAPWSRVQNRRSRF